jgi:hypothetical protein
MSLSPGLVAWKLAFQLSPIILTNGIATGMPLNSLPILVFTQTASFIGGILSGASDIENLDGFFANFQVLPGSTLVKNDLGRYPFANQQVAANAVIGQSLNVSMRMICPARDTGGYILKLATFSALKKALLSHTTGGGTFTVLTPSYIYTGCILLALTDVSGAHDKQVQTEYRWDFEQPLLSLEGALSAQNLAMNKITAGLSTDGSLSGLSASTGLLSTIGSLVPGSIGSSAAAPPAPLGSGSASIPLQLPTVNVPG